MFGITPLNPNHIPQSTSQDDFVEKTRARLDRAIQATIDFYEFKDQRYNKLKKQRPNIFAKPKPYAQISNATTYNNIPYQLLSVKVGPSRTEQIKVFDSRFTKSTPTKIIYTGMGPSGTLLSPKEIAYDKETYIYVSELEGYAPNLLKSAADQMAKLIDDGFITNTYEPSFLKALKIFWDNPDIEPKLVRACLESGQNPNDFFPFHDIDVDWANVMHGARDETQTLQASSDATDIIQFGNHFKDAIRDTTKKAADWMRVHSMRVPQSFLSYETVKIQLNDLHHLKDKSDISSQLDALSQSLDTFHETLKSDRKRFSQEGQSLRTVENTHRLNHHMAQSLRDVFNTLQSDLKQKMHHLGDRDVPVFSSSDIDRKKQELDLLTHTQKQKLTQFKTIDNSKYNAIGNGINRMYDFYDQALAFLDSARALHQTGQIESFNKQLKDITTKAVNADEVVSETKKAIGLITDERPKKRLLGFISS